MAMEPESTQTSPNSQPAPETRPPASDQPEVKGPEAAPMPIEAAPVASPEKVPVPVEQAPQPGGGISLPPVQPPADDDDNDPKAKAKSKAKPKGKLATPDIADDVDVIEMEWVNRAKQVIKETKDDPYAQEKAMEQLQADYLAKRYGKQIKRREG
jgi:Txe/YoeB family toxin of Txe-Axe toxin-antitoxin module